MWHGSVSVAQAMFLAGTSSRQSMSASPLAVLVVTDGTQNAPALLGYLQTCGCDVCSAASFQQAAEMLSTRRFALVLSEFILSDGTASRLIPLLRGTATTMFFSHAVEDDFWWMLVLYRGTDLWGEPAMRETQFKAFLDDILSTHCAFSIQKDWRDRIENQRHSYLDNPRLRKTILSSGRRVGTEPRNYESLSSERRRALRSDHADLARWNLIPMAPGSSANFRRWNIVIISILASLVFGILIATILLALEASTPTPNRHSSKIDKIPALVSPYERNDISAVAIIDPRPRPARPSAVPSF
jgi:hypothetical protein